MNPLVVGSVVAITALRVAGAQNPHDAHSHGATAPTVMSEADQKAMQAHMLMSPRRSPTDADRARANAVVRELRTAIEKYRDVKNAESDGFRMFAPQIRNQRVYHFTKGLYALQNQFRFNPSKPTSLLYKRDANGKLLLIGAMYTASRRASMDDLDRRVPLSIAQWHRHVNWCFPVGDRARWLETKNGRPVFGPLGVSTREECREAGGRFRESLFGWMVHANVFAGDDPAVIWGDEHAMSNQQMTSHKQTTVFR